MTDEKEVQQAIRKMLKEQGWTGDIRSWEHPADNTISVTIYRIKEKEQ